MNEFTRSRSAFAKTITRIHFNGIETAQIHKCKSCNVLSISTQHTNEQAHAHWHWLSWSKQRHNEEMPTVCWLPNACDRHFVYVRGTTYVWTVKKLKCYTRLHGRCCCCCRCLWRCEYSYFTAAVSWTVDGICTNILVCEFLLNSTERTLLFVQQ